MLRLKMPTDPKWASVAESNLEEILIDHAFCEQKAASSAISIIINYPEYSDLVQTLSEIAQEEMEHFQRVHKKIIERGYVLGRERKDEYVNRLSKFFIKTNDRKINLVQKLLFSAMIEARSCERFRVLSKNIDDKELAEFYHELMISEAEHYKVFLNYAKKYGKDLLDVNEVWENFLKYEADIIKDYGKKEFIHG